MKLIQNSELKIFKEWKKYIGKYIRWEDKDKDGEPYFSYMLLKDVKLCGKYSTTTLFYDRYCDGGNTIIKNTKTKVSCLNWDKLNFYIMTKKELDTERILRAI